MTSWDNTGVSENSDTPKSSILIGFFIIFTIHFWVPLFLETLIYLYFQVVYAYLVCFSHLARLSFLSLTRALVSDTSRLEKLTHVVPWMKGVRIGGYRYWDSKVVSKHFWNTQPKPLPKGYKVNQFSYLANAGLPGMCVVTFLEGCTQEVTLW